LLSELDMTEREKRGQHQIGQHQSNWIWDFQAISIDPLNQVKARYLPKLLFSSLLWFALQRFASRNPIPQKLSASHPARLKHDPSSLRITFFYFLLHLFDRVFFVPSFLLSANGSLSLPSLISILVCFRVPFSIIRLASFSFFFFR
jgi:hypothetical protein